MTGGLPPPPPPPAGPPLISARGLTKTYQRGRTPIAALSDVDLDVTAGEFLVVMGPSGGGKTTLLNLLGGVDRPTAGSLVVAGTPLHDATQAELDAYRRDSVGFVFQFFNLLPTADARDNVALALVARGRHWRAARDEAEHLLAVVGLQQRSRHRPSELSGGEQQRVAIARALAGEPALILADEPTGDVDSTTARAVMDLLADINRSRGTTVLVVTHNEILAGYGGRLCTMQDGRLVG